MLGPNGRRAPPDLASFLLKERIVYLVRGRWRLSFFIFIFTCKQ
jgi:hypothetical protein